MRVFISAVSSELERARDTVAADLRARDNFVKVQSDFRQEAADTLLRKLHDYIRTCEAVCASSARAAGPASGRRSPRRLERRNDCVAPGSPLRGDGGLREGAQRHPTT